MTATSTTTLTVAIIDGHRLTDDGLRRVAEGCTSVVSLATEDRSFADVEARWAVLAPGLAIEDGGRVDGVREAIVECARRGVVVIATPAPRKAATFVSECLQGAAAATEFDVPGIAVHVVRDEQRPGTVAWLSDTGDVSGYGVLFAVGYAAAHGVGVEMIEPTGGLDIPRTPGAVDDALARAEQWGVPLERHSDPSPISRVLRDQHSLVVHPVLDAPGGFNLLHPGHLPHKAVASGSPAAVVELIERFPGDVVAVYDAVHLLHGQVPAARIAAAAALGMVTISGVGIAIAGPASAATMSGADAAAVAVSDDARSVVEDAVFGMRFSLVPHHGNTDLVVRNTSGHSVVLTVSGYHGHGGSHAVDLIHEIPAGGSYTFSGGSGVKTWTSGSIVDIDGLEIPALQVMSGGHFLPPAYGDILDVAGTLQPQHPPVVTQGPADITTITGVDGPTLTTPGGGQGPVTGPAGVTMQVQGTSQVDVPTLTPQVPTHQDGPGGPTVTPPVHAQVDAPTLTPQVPTQEQGPQGPTVTPPVHSQVDAPTLTPQVPTHQDGPGGPTVTPPVHAQVDAPTLTPQVPTHQDGPGGPTVTPPVHSQVDAPTLTPQVPTHQDGPGGPTVTPPVHSQVDAPTLTPQVPTHQDGPGGPTVTPPVHSQVDAPTLTPQVPTQQQGPQGPTVTPPVHSQVDAPTLTPQVPRQEQGPQGPTVTPPVHAQVDAPTLVPQVPTHQDGPSGPTVTPPVHAQVDAPTLTPQVPTQQQGPQGPTVTPPVHAQVDAPTLTPQVPTQQQGPQGPTVTPPVHSQVDAPTLTPQVPTQQQGPQGPTVTPPVHSQVDAPTLTPQVPTQQQGPQGPTVTPPVHAQVDAPTLVQNLEDPPLSTPAGGGGPVIAPPTVTTTVSSVNLQEPPLPPTTTVTEVGTPTVDQVTSTTPTQIGDPTSTVTTSDQGPGAVTPGGGTAGGHGMGIVRPPATADGGGLIVQTPDGDHAPQGELAHTGANVALLGGVAAALLAAGAGLAALGRKKSEDA